MATPITAANAYAALSRITNAAASVSKAAGTEGGEGGEGNFGAMLKQAIGSVVEAGRSSDAQSKAMAAGKANIVDVVTAVAETEVAVEALVSVRDKVIQAYEEIMRMPI
jgi:flagellar hook-basal body complex protein FliE